MLEKVNVNTATNIRLESAVKKSEVSEAAKTPQARQIGQIFNRCVGLIKTFSEQVKDNQDCHNHSLSMRHGAAKVKHVALPFFQKLKEFVNEQASKLTQNRIIRKLKDMLELLETLDLNFVRKGEMPLTINTMAAALAELLERYRDFERLSSSLLDPDHRSQLAEILAFIAKIAFTEDKFHIRNAMVGEILTKHLVTRAVAEGDQLELPCFNGQEPCVVSYGLNSRLTLGKSGIPVLVYAPLEEKDKSLFPPLLLFRGTKVNFSNAVDISSMLENLHRIGPARQAYDQFKGDLQAFLKQWFREKPTDHPLFRVMGFSQGAVLGQRALVDFFPYFERRPFQESLLFNSPALEEDYYTAWEAIPEDLKPFVFIYLSTNDVVSKRGFRFASRDIFEIKPVDPKKWLGAHLGAKLIDPECEVFQVDNPKESESPSRKLVNQLCSSSAVETIYKHLSPRFYVKAKPNHVNHQTRLMD